MEKKLNWKGLRRSDPDGPRPLADAVLRLIWRERRISRADIAQQAELSRSTVSEIVNEILPMGLVAEVGLGSSARRAAAGAPGVPGRRVCHPGRRDGRGPRRRGADRPAWAGARVARPGAPGPHRPRGDARAHRGALRACLGIAGDSDRPLVGIGVALPCPFDPADPDRAIARGASRLGGAARARGPGRAVRCPADGGQRRQPRARWPSTGGARAGAWTISRTSRSRRASAPVTSSTERSTAARRAWRARSVTRPSTPTASRASAGSAGAS